MTDERQFVDTNVLVYLFDDEFPEKQARARELLAVEVGKPVLSTQVLGEFFHAVTRKIKRPLSAEQASRATDHLGRFLVWPIHRGLVRAAISRRIASRFSYWDSLIIETALEARAAALLTEDLQHGQAFGPLRVVNPFRGAE